MWTARRNKMTNEQDAHKQRTIDNYVTLSNALGNAWWLAFQYGTWELAETLQRLREEVDNDCYAAFPEYHESVLEELDKIQDEERLQDEHYRQRLKELGEI
jgi:hypothetical protein